MRRNAVNPCTLIPHPTKACQLSSNETAVDYPGMEVPRGRLPILLGGLLPANFLRGGMSRAMGAARTLPW